MKEGNFEEEIIFGVHPVLEALKNGADIDKLLIQKGIAPEHFKPLNAAAHDAQIPYQLVPKEKLNRLTRANHQGVIAFISAISFFDWEQVVDETLKKGKVPLLLYLDGVTDVRNFGAIARSAYCFGVDAILIPARGSARIGGDAMKTSAGALMHQKVCRVFKPLDMFDTLLLRGFNLIACTEKAKSFSFEANFTQPTVILMGSEDEGLSHDITAKCQHHVKIPMVNQSIGSLNVSVATGAMLYEVNRQRLIKP